jgi:molecular chaperone DnaK
VEIHVLQGEREFARDSKSIGKFTLDQLPPAPRGVPQIEVRFDIDANGILNVSAKYLGTGKEQKITITASSGLAKDEIERMRRDGELHAGEDRKRKAELEQRNEADHAVYRAERLLKDPPGPLSAGDRERVTAELTQARDALQSGDPARIQITSTKLTATCQAVAAAAVDPAQAGPNPGPQSSAEAGPGGGPEAHSTPPAGGPPGAEPVIDAEVVEERRAA